MNTHSAKKYTSRPKSNRITNNKRVKSAKRRINKRMIRDKSDEQPKK